MLNIEEIINQNPETGWSKKEFSMISFGDERVDKRFMKVSEQLSKLPGVSINEACGVWKDTKAAYRLFANEKVTKEIILEAHQNETLKRMEGSKRVLIIQDTTYIDFTRHKSKKDLGPIGASNMTLQGLVMHNTLAITEDELPLGLIGQEIWVREKEIRNKREHKKLPIEKKESYKWLDSLVKTEKLRPEEVTFINVSDRESDIYEYFVKARELGSKILLRSTQSRNLSGEDSNLWEYIGSKPVEGKLEIKVPVKKTGKERKAVLEIRYGTVTLEPPAHLKSSEKLKLGSVTIDAVIVKEIDTPLDVEAIEWNLLTNISVKSYEDAVERINWYKKRWNIEVYHKVIKSGCSVEKCRLETTNRLIPYLTLCSIIAWRLFWMTKINRQEPDAPATAVLEESELDALYIMLHSKKRPPGILPTVREAIRWIAQLGGFLGRKGDKEPGIITIWRGWQRLQDISHMWLVLKSCQI